MPRTALLLLAATVCACAPLRAPAPHASPRPEPSTLEDAVLPYSPELETAQGRVVPFMARFERGDQSLIFVAASHGCDPKTFRLIDEAFTTRRVRVVVVEGYPASKGLDPPEFVGRLDEWAAGQFCAGGGEIGYAAAEARKRGLPFTGGEPDEPAVVQAVLGQGFTREDLLGFYFVGQVPQLRREGALDTKSLDANFQSLIAAMSKRAGLEEASAHFSLEQFELWYQRKQGKKFDAATMDSEEAAPIPSGKYFTQRISVVRNIVRDRFIARRIANLLASDKQVLVVYGGSHFPTLRPALELLMGSPIFVPHI
jgi:hypothetical protein